MLRASALACCLLCLSAFAQSRTAAAVSSGASSRLDADVAELRYDDLARDLTQIAPGPEHDLFAGVLADRSSRFEESIRLLTPLVTAADMPRSRMALVLGSLADDYVKTFHYAQASTLYDRLLGGYADVLSPALLNDDRDDNDTLKLLLQAAPQTMELNGVVDLPTRSDPLSSFVADLTVHGVTVPWILDTGANFSVVSESFAKQIGVAPSAGVAHTMGSTGVENPLHAGVLDELHVGSATLHNVVLLILPDANLTIPRGKQSYVIPAILGYPVFQSLGIVRFTHDNRFLAGPSLETSGEFSAIYMEKLNVLFSCRTHGVSRLFQFDSGANATTFFVPYYREFPSDFNGQKIARRRGYGAGGVATDSVYLLDHTQSELGGRIAELQHVAVFRAPQNVLADHYYGNLGRDLMAGFDGITLDFTKARVTLGPRLGPSDKSPQ